MSVRRLEGRELAALAPRMRSFRKKTPISAIQLDYDFELVQANDAAARATGQSVISGSLVCPAGTWLARSPAGTYYPIPKEQFDLMYESDE